MTPYGVHRVEAILAKLNRDLPDPPRPLTTTTINRGHATATPDRSSMTATDSIVTSI